MTGRGTWGAALAGAALALLATGAANAKSIALGDISNASLEVGNTVGKGAFMDDVTFSLSADSTEWSFGAIVGVATGKASNFTNGLVALYEVGNPSAIATSAFTETSLAHSVDFTASLSELLGPGSYHLEVSGVSHVKALSWSSSVMTAAVPEPSTWAMLGLGFAVVGLAGFARQRKEARLAA